MRRQFQLPPCRFEEDILRPRAAQDISLTQGIRLESSRNILKRVNAGSMAFSHWRELPEIKEACAWLFAAARYQSLNMATTQVGPLLVEVNGGFDLPQLASRSGFLSKDVRKF